MVVLNHADFLTFWETGHRMHPLDRSLLAIESSLPANPGDSVVADWPLGRRNRALAQFRSLYFGPRLEGWTGCPGCGEKLEFELDCRVLADKPETPADARVSVDGGTFRLPTSRDLVHLLRETDPMQAEMRLLENCFLGSEQETDGGNAAEDGPGAARLWLAEKRDAVAEKMAEVDPLAEISVGFDCPLCHYTGEVTLDLVHFLWTEIESRARRLLSEVHVLAGAYGWTEATILAMSDVRRGTYVRMVQG